MSVMRIIFGLVSSIFICFISIIPAISQNFISDTISVTFGDSTIYSIDFNCDSIVDSRKSGPHVLTVAQGKKYVIKYFDIYYTTTEPLSNEVKNAFQWTNTGNTIKLNIERFEVKGYSKKKKDGDYLYSQIAISEVTDTGFLHVGTLIHEISSQRSFPFPSETLPSDTPIEAWKYLFAKNMNELSLNIEPGNFYTQKVRPHFIPRVIVHIGLKSIIVDGEFWFTNPEASRSFTTKSYKLRYRNSPAFESIGFQVINNTAYYRLNDNFMLLSNYSTFIGINRWKDFDKRKLGFQDILHLNFSASQGILFQPKYKKGFVAGIGITEDIVGIYKQKIVFEPAVFILVGIKL